MPGGILVLVLPHKAGTFDHRRPTTALDHLIAAAECDRHLAQGQLPGTDAIDEDAPGWRAFGGRLRHALRYGENPHQKASFYSSPNPRKGVATAEQLQGKELSYINLLDADAAFELAAEFNPAKGAAVVIVKHANPCGVAIGKTPREAYERALACDPVSRFGGIIAVNSTLDLATAEVIADIFTEVIIAPDVSEQARAFLAKKKNVRVLSTGGLPDPKEHGWTARSVAGGLLVQQRDNATAESLTLKVVTKRAPSAQELADLLFAFRVCKHVKSNAIVNAKNEATVGIGAGQMSRVDSARIARRKAEDAAHEARKADPETIGSVAASDAFFPFPDGLEQVARRPTKQALPWYSLAHGNSGISAAVAIEWLDPWCEVSDPAIREGLARQLAAEIGKKHALYRVSLGLIARRDD